jgi:hypothetical protein
MTMLGGVLPRDEIATPGESFTGEFRSAGREQHSAIRSALAQPLPGGKHVMCCIVLKAEADQRTSGPHEACALDDFHESRDALALGPPRVADVVPSTSETCGRPDFRYGGAAFARRSAVGKRLELGRPRRRLLTRQDAANSRDPGDCRIPIGEQQRGAERAPHTRSSS